MSKIESYQRLAEREAKRLGITIPLRVVWKGECDQKRWAASTRAHAHTWVHDLEYGLICIRRGLDGARDTIKHEIAHFVKGANSHRSVAFARARAAQGEEWAKRELIQRGHRRCPGHVWSPMGIIEQKATRRGLLTLSSAYCVTCGKRLP